MFQMVRRDMLTVKARLAQTDTGVVTQGVEDEIINNLTDMVEALKKQRQANKDKSGKAAAAAGPAEVSRAKTRWWTSSRSSSCCAPCRRASITAPASTTRNTTANRRRRRTPPRTPRSGQHYEMIQKEMKELAETEAKISKILKDMLTGKNARRLTPDRLADRSRARSDRALQPAAGLRLSWTDEPVPCMPIPRREDDHACAPNPARPVSFVPRPAGAAELHTLKQETITGDLVGLSNKEIVIAAGAGKVTTPIDQVLTLTFGQQTGALPERALGGRGTDRRHAAALRQVRRRQERGDA